jgi:hypothetical protein
VDQTAPTVHRSACQICSSKRQVKLLSAVNLRQVNDRGTLSDIAMQHFRPSGHGRGRGKPAVDPYAQIPAMHRWLDVDCAGPSGGSDRRDIGVDPLNADSVAGVMEIANPRNESLLLSNSETESSVLGIAPELKVVPVESDRVKSIA